MRARYAGAMAAVSMLTVLAGCGGGGSPGSAKAAYITQVDSICKATFSKSASIGNNQDAATAQKQSDLYMATATQVTAITKPTESIELARQFNTQLENIGLAYLAAARAFPDQAKATKYFGQVADLKKNAASTSKEYGFKDCQQING